ncbi:pleckstrin homology domain-containing family A member 7-like, partial [Cetorhinus maximus]
AVRTMKKVHTFAKRDQAIKRDPNSVTVIRGWLHKQDSCGLKLWKRRWFVLSDFCLFYYRDSREERILGSIPMPSYIISAAVPQDRKTRKFIFKAEHPGMRTYYFSADTQEDMNGWIRALIQSARVESENANISSMKSSKRLPQEQEFSSFEDFTKSGLFQQSGSAQSAESLEIAKLSEPRHPLGSRSEMMEKKLEKVRQELLAPTNSHRGDPSLTISLEQLTPPTPNGTVPPPTPTSGVHNRAFRFEDAPNPGAEYTEPHRRSSLSHVEQWVRSQKGKLPEGQRDEHYVVKTASGHVYECLVDGYPVSSVSSQLHGERSIPISLSSGNMQQQSPSYYLNQEQEERLHHEASPAISIYQSRIFPSNTPDLISSRTTRSLRSNSLPITSDTPRYQVLRRSHTPDDRYAILSEGQQGSHLSETPSEGVSQGSLDRASIPQNSPVTSKPPVPFSRSSQRAQSPLERSESRSHVDVHHMGSSQRASRALIRPHTPIGRIDILPSPQASPTMRSSYLQIPGLFAGPHSLPANVTLLPTEEQPGEYYMASTFARARGQTLNRPYSRPQTPSNRVDVLPSEEHYGFLSNKFHGPFRIQQRSPTPFERMTAVPRDEMDIEGLSVTTPSRRSENYRPHTPVVLPGKDHHKEMSLGRHRIPGTRGLLTYQNRCFPPPPSHISRTVRTLGLSGKTGSISSFTELPPRPPTSARPSPNLLLSPVGTLSLSPSIYGEYTTEPVKMVENEVDVLLTRLCGQDRVLQGLVNEVTQLKAEKDKLEGVWEATHCQMMDFERQPNIVERLAFQQQILQEDLIQIRARLCDLSTDMEQSWNEYEFLENELQRFRSTRELLTRCGSAQERGEAQRDLWMIEDVILGLSSNRKSFQAAIGSTQQPVIPFTASPVLEHPFGLQSDSLQTPFESSPLPSPNSGPHRQVLDDVPCRPPLPTLLHHNQHSKAEHCGAETASPPIQSEQKHTQGERNGNLQNNSVTNGNYRGQHTLTAGGIHRKGKMSAEEQMERMKRHQEAHLQQKPRTGILSQRSVAVSPIMRGAMTGESRPNSANLLTNRPVTNHSTGAHLPASAVPSRTRPGNTPTVPTKPTSTPEPPGTRNEMASSKLVTKLSAPPEAAESHTREHNRIVRKQCKPSKVVITTRYIDVDPETPLSPEQLQEKQRTLEKIKTMIAKTSPDVAGCWAPADRAMFLGERERERIINLSYTLATEASQRSRVLTAKALAEFQKQEEEMGSQSVQNNIDSQPKLQKNGVAFNLGHHKETTNTNVEYHQKSANPRSGHQEGTANPRAGHQEGTANPRSGHQAGTANPRPGHQAGTANPRPGHQEGTANPRSGHQEGTANPRSGHQEGTANPRSGHQEGTANPRSGHQEGTANPRSGHINQGERTKQHATKDNSPTNPSLTLEIEPANRKLGEQQSSSNLDLSPELEGVSVSSAGRGLGNMSFLMGEGCRNVTLGQE